MCGILGYIACSDSRPTSKAFEEALVACSDRGHDATGLFSLSTGIVKKDVTATQFVKKYAKDVTESVKNNIVLAHCRATTRGPEENNQNNHPHESANYILIHNGAIGKSPKMEDYKYNGECDSEIILSYLEKYGIKKGLEEMHDDSMAIAIYSKKENKVYLYRNIGPTTFFLDKKEKIIYFASTFDILKSFKRSTTKLGFNVLDEQISLESTKEKLICISPENGVESSIDIKHKPVILNIYKHRKDSGFSGYQRNTSNELTYCFECKQMKLPQHDCCEKVNVNNGRFTSVTHKINGKETKTVILYRGGSVKYCQK